jgi:hypothetical protein
MAVSQVERLKNPGREWMWKSLVATQPPPSAPGDADQAGEDQAL